MEWRRGGMGKSRRWDEGREGVWIFFKAEFMIAHTHTDTHTHTASIITTHKHNNTTPSHERACDQDEGEEGRREGWRVLEKDEIERGRGRETTRQKYARHLSYYTEF
jgi:hypothetical protein